MSWQSYVDDHLMVDLPSGGKLTAAAIYGQDGGCWAQSAGFPALDADQAKILVTGFSDPGAVAASGIRIGDKKFISIGGIPGECLRGRKGAGGCTVKKTNTAMVIGIYDEGVQGGDCNVIVENLGDYLIGQNI
ncbi:profilin [Chloropicon primus]|uniref:Profilin n=1 Tax=Chloropicon primus TaxID=1764295 RepID=A0A5B8MJ43_9CHLO|nr:profilin [Chloropicon primus]UPQ99501.1 profilin [Chloropicon primus]|mmetsp:Transcript_5006/g.14972  ORF Transcript_5006/g.14972 Transcript_5006/m.14972 type:complete len:133 (+) Transcript_5006:99-497(+)|eukprot:QDZ20291.1 profilin [Chloropicon primus]